MEEKDSLFNDEAREFMFSFLRSDNKNMFIFEGNGVFHIYMNNKYYTMIIGKGKVREGAPFSFKVRVLMHKLYTTITRGNKVE